jgi:uncharacterized protein
MTDDESTLIWLSALSTSLVLVLTFSFLHKPSSMGYVSQLWRFAVKGLDYDQLSTVQVSQGEGFPFDRRYALRYLKHPSHVVPALKSAPLWQHKSNFLCAFTAGKILGQFQTSFDDNSNKLTVKDRSTGKVRLQANLATDAGRTATEIFFATETDQAVELVEGSHFGNTPAGALKGNGKLPIVHIINATTVRHVSRKCGVTLYPSRFRPNIVVDGMPAWDEFALVNKTIQIGGCVFKVLNRTVRCKGTNHDNDNINDDDEINVPKLLQKHYPQHGPYLGVYAQVVDNVPPSTIQRGSIVQDFDPWALGIFWRLLHSFAAATYVFAAIELKQQQKQEWVFSFLSFILSVVWSLTRYGGNSGWLVFVDHVLAYVVILCNYYFALQWPNGIIGFFQSEWNELQVQAFLLCHLAVPIYFLEDVLRRRCPQSQAWFYYGAMHLTWRFVGGVGGLLVAKASTNSTSMF